jgi:GR25 family glycosyltransferase involved in LPS biosynthesis
MKILVINLPTRSDRYELFKKHWDWLSPIEHIDGQISEIPHTGCGLAHCKAIRKGLENHDICLVLEDDARLSCSRSNLIEVLTEIRNYKNKYDAIILGPVFDSANPTPPDIIHKVSDNFMRCSSTKSIESATAVVWFRSCLPLLDIYEQLLKEGYIFPIDRMLTTFFWTASETVGWHKSFTPKYPIALIKPIPRVLISNKCLIYQEANLISDNTKQLSEDLLKKSDEFLGRIYGDKALTNNI